MPILKARESLANSIHAVQVDKQFKQIKISRRGRTMHQSPSTKTVQCCDMWACHWRFICLFEKVTKKEDGACGERRLPSIDSLPRCPPKTGAWPSGNWAPRTPSWYSRWVARDHTLGQSAVLRLLLLFLSTLSSCFHYSSDTTHTECMRSNGSSTSQHELVGLFVIKRVIKQIMANAFFYCLYF